MNSSFPNLQITLQQARKASRLSQLELSLRVGVSQRHVSYVESGRAKPSRELLQAWLHELNMPLIARNAAMLQAGYAPIYSNSSLAEPVMAEANDALLHLLHAHDPMPAFVIDADWNVLHLNDGGRWLAAMLMPWMAQLPDDTPMNMLDAFCHPEGFARHMLNIDEVGPALLAHLRDEASMRPALASRVEAFAGLLRLRAGAHTGSRGSLAAWPSQAAPVLTSRFSTAHGELAFFSMFTTFGTPQDITLASLRVEHMFAADERTRTVLRANVVPA
jgi:transcriptional regulator with XRE-family HTH domain